MNLFSMLCLICSKIICIITTACQSLIPLASFFLYSSASNIRAKYSQRTYFMRGNKARHKDNACWTCSLFPRHHQVTIEHLTEQKHRCTSSCCTGQLPVLEEMMHKSCELRTVIRKSLLSFDVSGISQISCKVQLDFLFRSHS